MARALPPEEHEFLLEKIAAGLSDREAARVFLREFGRLVSEATVRRRRER